MKYKILNTICWPYIYARRTTRTLRALLRRVYYTARLKAEIKDMDFSVQCDGAVNAIGTRDIRIGRRCRIGVDAEFETMEKGRIYLGDDIRINRGCTITSYSEIFIDDFSIIGEFVSIRDANHGIKKGESMRYQPHTSNPIRIGRDVWIGRGSCVLPGVSIEEGAVIGANSVVSRDIPAFSIAAGAPAKVIKKRK
jgi:acetyltransferase-like isoleucine patch superfamily enzyme